METARKWKIFQIIYFIHENNLGFILLPALVLSIFGCVVCVCLCDDIQQHNTKIQY